MLCGAAEAARCVAQYGVGLVVGPADDADHAVGARVVVAGLLGGVFAGVGLLCSVVVLVLLFRAWARGVNKGPAIRASVPKSSMPMGSHLMVGACTVLVWWLWWLMFA